MADNQVEVEKDTEPKPAHNQCGVEEEEDDTNIGKIEITLKISTFFKLFLIIQKKIMVNKRIQCRKIMKISRGQYLLQKSITKEHIHN